MSHSLEWQVHSREEAIHSARRSLRTLEHCGGLERYPPLLEKIGRNTWNAGASRCTLLWEIPSAQVEVRGIRFV